MSIFDASILDIAFFIIKVIIALVLVVTSLPILIFILKFVFDLFLMIFSSVVGLFLAVFSRPRSEFDNQKESEPELQKESEPELRRIADQELSNIEVLSRFFMITGGLIFLVLVITVLFQGC